MSAELLDEVPDAASPDVYAANLRREARRLFRETHGRNPNHAVRAHPLRRLRGEVHDVVPGLPRARGLRDGEHGDGAWRGGDRKYDEPHDRRMRWVLL